MKTGFKETVKLQSRPKAMKSPWNFDAPQYDERTSCFVSAGTDHGVGVKTPVGTMGQGKGYSVPVGRPKTLGLYHERNEVQVDE